MSNEIKIGDRVNIVDNGGYFLFRNQRTGTVKKLSGGLAIVEIDNYGGYDLSFDKECLRVKKPNLVYRFKLFGIPVLSITREEEL